MLTANEIITEEERKEILDNMEKLLEEYDYTYTERALNKIIDTWAEDKAGLIALFKKHPNYIDGKFMIAFDKDYSRDVDPHGVKMFVKWINSHKSEFIKNLNEEPKEIAQKDRERRIQQYMDVFGCTFDYAESRVVLNFPEYACKMFDTYFLSKTFLGEGSLEVLNKISPNLRFSEGMKMSRAVNKVCTWLGINKHPEYNKEFAKFADAINPLKIVRHTIISINPIDYLTMSFGNSWASCHTIDKKNTRGMDNSYEGMYSSGTVSYMLDGVSMVFYTVDASYNGNEYFFQDKINRNMFHYGNDKLIQGRVYPQCNDDGGNGIYKDFREIVQSVMAECLGIPNLWITKHGTSEIYPWVESYGTHYCDYTSFDQCCISRPKGIENEELVKIGHNPICIECGYEHSVENCINCCRSNNTICCAACGEVIDEDEAWYISGDYYCCDCSYTCECCDERVVRDDITFVYNRSGWEIGVCEECRDEYYEYCEHCGDYYQRDCMNWVESEREYVCDNCFENEFGTCDACGEIHLMDNLHYDEETGDNYCNYCYEELLEERENESEEEESEVI